MKVRDETDRYNLPIVLPTGLYQILEPYREILYGDKKKRGKPRPKRRGGQDRNRREKNRGKPKH